MPRVCSHRKRKATYMPRVCSHRKRKAITTESSNPRAVIGVAIIHKQKIKGALSTHHVKDQVD